MTLADITPDIDPGELPWFLLDPDPEVYLTRPWLALDFETTNIEKGSALVQDNKVVCAAWTERDSPQICYRRGDELHQAALLDAIDRTLDAGGFLIGHNIKFELQWLARAGLDLTRVLVYDTMIGDFVRAGNRKWALDLGSVCRRYGGSGKTVLVDSLIKGGVCPSQISDDLIHARVTKDVWDTVFVFLKQRRALCEGKLLATQYTRCLLTPALASMETQGLGLDAGRVREEHAKATAEYFAVTAKINEFTGAAVRRLPADHPLRELTGSGPVNPRSAPQMAYFLYDVLKFKELRKRNSVIRGKPSLRFPGGVPKTDDDTLAALVAKNEGQRTFLALKRRASSLASDLSKTLDFFLGTVNEFDGVFYGSFNQCIAQTHRLTSSGRKRTFSTVLDKKAKPRTMGIQLQNMPRKFKDLIRAKRPGLRFGNGDGSQLEFRVAAFLGRDDQAKWNIRHDVDQHSLTASVLTPGWADADKAGRKLMRDAAKPETFKPLYGGRYGTQAQMTYYTWFREQFPQLNKVQDGWCNTVLRTKELRTVTGLKFYWPFTRMSAEGYIDNTPSIYNYPVQSLATADIIPVAVVYLWHRAARQAPQISVVLTVHDSVSAELRPEDAPMWGQLCARAFTADVYRYLSRVYRIEFDVPLGVGVAVGSRWNSADSVEAEWNVEPTGECWAKGDRKVVDRAEGGV